MCMIHITYNNGYLSKKLSTGGVLLEMVFYKKIYN